MIRKKNICFILLVFFVSLSFAKQSELYKYSSKSLFSNNWYFVNLDKLHKQKNKPIKTIQTGKNWKSQYFIENVNVSGKNNLVKKILRKELRIIKEKKWKKINLPYSSFIEPLIIKYPQQGISYYKKSFYIPVKDKSLNLFIRFEGAMQLAYIWINGKYVFKHSGGYTPFEIKLNNFIKYGSDNEILVRLDNRDNPLIPPGKPIDRLDFCYYSGLYRDVYLRKTGKLFIPDSVAADIPAAGGVFLQYPAVNKDKASLSIKTTVKNDFNTAQSFLLEQILYNKENEIIAKTIKKIRIKRKNIKIINQEILIKKPKLWSLESPYLYKLITRIKKDNEIYDEFITKTGIRTISFTRGNGFVLNGKRIKLIGTNRHQEYPYVGNALSDNAQFRDMVKIKNGGFNLVRLGHYPQAPAVLDACDELGLLVIEPIPGWQFFNNNKDFVKRTIKDIKDMIRRDRNHPSIILWETVLNESRLPLWWKKKAYKTAHEEYPGKQCYTAGDMYGTYIWDVLYNDWNENFTRPNDSKKPGFIREYGDYEFGGDKSTTRVRRGKGEEKLLISAWNFQWSLNRYNAYYPWTSGNATWEMFDHNRGCCDTISASGASDIFRIPKFTWYFFRSQKNIRERLAFKTLKPEIYIANYWLKSDKTKKVIVYGNVEEVKLFVNETMVARKKPDKGPDSFYFKKGETAYMGGHPFDGGNCKRLKYPPFTFKNIKWKDGVLKAIGYIKNKKVAEYTVKTPEESAKLKIKIDFSGRFPKYKRKDILFVYVSVIDKNNTLCISDNNSEITLKLKGAKLLSPSKIKTEAGIASFLISTFKNSQIIIEAQASIGLKSSYKFNLK